MSKPKLIILLLTLVGAIGSCAKPSTESANSSPVNASAPEKPPIASTNVVKVTPSEVTVPLGQSAEVIIRLNIDSGYHINANPPTFPYLKATELEIPQNKDVSIGFITYPNPVTKKFAFAEKQLAVYEGEVPLKIFLKANKGAKSGTQNLPAKLRVQACDEQVCYAPGVIEFTIPVSVK